MAAGSPADLPTIATDSLIPESEASQFIPSVNRSSSEPIHVVTYSDHPVFRSSLSWKICPDSGIAVVADAPSLYDTLALIDEAKDSGGQIDAVIADLRIGDGNSEGIESVRTLASSLDTIPVVVCSDLGTSSYSSKMIKAGAAAVVQKSAGVDQLVNALREVVSANSSNQANPDSLAA